MMLRALCNGILGSDIVVCPSRTDPRGVLNKSILCYEVPQLHETKTKIQSLEESSLHWQIACNFEYNKDPLCIPQMNSTKSRIVVLKSQKNVSILCHSLR